MNLDKLIRIERRGQAQDTAGEVKDTWLDSGDAWASIRPVSGREYFNASGKRAEVSHEIILRYGATVAPRDRILYRKRIFDVVSVFNVDERDRYLKLMSIEHAD
jgi:SPP1 family predicted phage head-tail adaptor